METNKRIFIVDDDLFSLNSYEQGLKGHGHTHVETFDNGSLCLNRLHEKPKVIFLDHQMNGLNGFETLKKIKRYDPDIYVVMVSGQEDMKTAIDALKYGAFDYIIKNGGEVNRMQEVLERIGRIEDEFRRQNPSLLRKLLSFF